MPITTPKAPISVLCSCKRRLMPYKCQCMIPTWSKFAEQTRSSNVVEDLFATGVVAECGRSSKVGVSVVCWSGGPWKWRRCGITVTGKAVFGRVSVMSVGVGWKYQVWGVCRLGTLDWVNKPLRVLRLI